jgi:hypothetical protein
VSADLRAAMEARRLFGIAKHGTPVQRENGRDHGIDALQEMLDAAVYFEAWDERAFALADRVMVRLREGGVNPAEWIHWSTQIALLAACVQTGMWIGMRLGRREGRALALKEAGRIASETSRDACFYADAPEAALISRGADAVGDRLTAMLDRWEENHLFDVFNISQKHY